MSRIDRGTEARVDGRVRTRASSTSRRAALRRRLGAGGPRRALGLLAGVILLGVAGVAVAAPTGSPVSSTGQPGGLIKAGPVNPDNGFPDWYRDSNKLDLEPCIDARDPNCNAPPVPDAGAAPTFPDNFPDEFFYMLADANMTGNGGSKILGEFALEGAFGSGPVKAGDQMVFARIRFRVTGGLQPNTEYTVTHPYGTDVLKTDAGANDLFITQDVGLIPGDFNGALAGRVGPFLTWDTFGQSPAAGGPPAGYIGDPATPHAVTGSALGTNFVKIEGPGIGGANNANPCPGLTATTSPDCVYTDQFSLTGKLSTRAGVDVARATYSRAADGSGTQVDVLAGSKLGQDIVVQDPAATPAFPVTPLRGESERYLAHVNVDGAPPSTVDVVNRGDVPKTVKHVPVTDLVTGSAIFHVKADGTDSLHVEGASSDKTTTVAGPTAKLSVPELNTDLDASGAADIPMQVPPATVKIASSQGGSITVPVAVDGPGMAPLALTADAGPDQTVPAGATVQLNGNGSAGNISSFSWAQTDGPAQVSLTGADTATPSFTAPATPGDYTFTLTVNGVDGTPPAPATSTDQVIVHVDAVTDAQAKIAVGGTLTDPATPVSVTQNAPVTLDGSQSVSAAKFAWTQESGPAVDLGAANGPTETFTVPTTDQPIVIRLTVRNAADGGGACAAPTCASTTVTLAPTGDTLTITKARFIPDKSRWVVTGTATVLGQNQVSVYSGPTIDPAKKIGVSPVDTLGNWAVDSRDSSVPLDHCGCVSVQSAHGGQVLAFLLEKADTLPLPPAAPATAPAALAARAAVAAPAAAPTVAAAVPLAGAVARLGAARVAAPATITAGALATRGVAVAVGVPAGARVVRLRVLTRKAKVLFRTFRRARGGKRLKVHLRSTVLQRRLRAGRRYLLEVTPGTARNRLGKATRRAFRVRR